MKIRYTKSFYQLAMIHCWIIIFFYLHLLGEQILRYLLAQTRMPSYSILLNTLQSQKRNQKLIRICLLLLLVNVEALIQFYPLDECSFGRAGLACTRSYASFVGTSISWIKPHGDTYKCTSAGLAKPNSWYSKWLSSKTGKELARKISWPKDLHSW